MKKKYLYCLIILLVFIVLIFSQCQLKKSVTISYMFYGDSDKYKNTFNVTELFHKKNPDIIVKLINYNSWTEYIKVINELSKDNALPDLFRMTIYGLPKLTERKQLADLGRVKVINPQVIHPKILLNCKVGDKLYAIPMGLVAQTLAYRKDFFDKADVAYPNKNWTWDDLITHSLKLKNNNVPHGLDVFFDVDDSFLYFVRSKSESLLSSDLKSTGFSYQTILDFFTLIDHLKNSDVITDLLNVYFWADVHDIDPFYNHKSAMRITWTNNIMFIHEVLDTQISLSLIPGQNNKEGIIIEPVSIICISKKSKKKKAAGKFIQFLLSDLEANKIFLIDNHIPTDRSIRKQLYPEIETQRQLIWDYINFLEDYHTRPLDKQLSPYSKECLEKIKNKIHDVYYNNISPQDASEQIIKEWNELLQIPYYFYDEYIILN